MPRSGEEVTSSAPNKEGERREYPLEKGNLVQGACKAVAITQRRRSQRRRVVRDAEIGRLWALHNQRFGDQSEREVLGRRQLAGDAGEDGELRTSEPRRGHMIDRDGQENEKQRGNQ